MDLFTAIHTRRSIKHFTDRVITRDEIERLVDAAVRAPNHRLTQPWRFRVLGSVARRAYGTVLGSRKAKKIDDPGAAQAVIDKVAAAEAAVPATIAVSVVGDDDPEVDSENYAATMMAVENLLLAACAIGLGTHLKTGAVMDDPRARAALGIEPIERIVAMIHLGEPAEIPAGPTRRDAGELTVWLE